MEENPCSDPSLQQGYYAPTGKEVGPPAPADHYEGLELILKSRSDGESWFDRIFDLITADCQGDPESEENTCTCGLESMGGSGGTLDQCYAWSTSVGQGLQPIDLARTILALADGWSNSGLTDETEKVIDWARKEVEFEDCFNNREWEDDEDDEGSA